MIQKTELKKFYRILEHLLWTIHQNGQGKNWIHSITGLPQNWKTYNSQEILKSGKIRGCSQENFKGLTLQTNSSDFRDVPQKTLFELWETIENRSTSYMLAEISNYGMPKKLWKNWISKVCSPLGSPYFLLNNIIILAFPADISRKLSLPISAESWLCWPMGTDHAYT